MGSGCGSVGRAVASNTRGPRFESSHWQTFISEIHFYIVNCIEKTKIKEKRPGMAHFKKPCFKYYPSACPKIQNNIIKSLLRHCQHEGKFAIMRYFKSFSSQTILIILFGYLSVLPKSIFQTSLQKSTIFQHNFLKVVNNISISKFLFLEKLPIPASFSFIFDLFKQAIHFLQQINVRKCQNVHPDYSTGIRTHDVTYMSRHP